MGSCLCMKCNIIIDLQDDLKIVKYLLSFMRYEFLKTLTFGFDRKERSDWGHVCKRNVT